MRSGKILIKLNLYAVTRFLTIFSTSIVLVINSLNILFNGDDINIMEKLK